MCVNIILKSRWLILHSHILRPAQRPGVDKIHRAAVTSPRACVSSGKFVVIASDSVGCECFLVLVKSAKAAFINTTMHSHTSVK